MENLIDKVAGIRYNALVNNDRVKISGKTGLHYVRFNANNSRDEQLR